MMAQPAIALGLPLRLLAEAEGVSAAQVIPDHVVGDYRDLDTLRTVTDGCAVVTFDHEHVPTEHLHALDDAGVAVPARPGRAGARPGQGRDAGAAHRARRALPAARDRRRPAEDVEAFGFPCVLKTTRGGYDGKGVWFVRSAADCAEPLRGRRGARGGAARRGAGRLPPRAVGAGGPVAERPGRGVPGRRLDPARRHLPRGGRAGARPRPRAGRPRRSRSRCGSPASSTSPASWPSSCSRPPTAGSWSTSSRCGRTTPGTGPRTAR